jgi:hypothetical protein
MRVIVKVRFNASKERFEKFADDKYLLYLPFGEDSDAMRVIKELLSRYLGTLTQRIEFIAVDSNKNWIFDVH